MKIRVTYGELRSRHFDNVKAEASVEIDVVEGNAEETFNQAWAAVKEQVKRQLDPASDSLNKLQQMDMDRDFPF